MKGIYIHAFLSYDLSLTECSVFFCAFSQEPLQSQVHNSPHYEKSKAELKT